MRVWCITGCVWEVDSKAAVSIVGANHVDSRCGATSVKAMCRNCSIQVVSEVSYRGDQYKEAIIA